jgi:quercetin dioxygenase-like cupin family protein
MEILDITGVAPYDSERFVAQALAQGENSNVRIIRLSPGQTLPPHTHGDSDLFLFAVEGEGRIETESGPRPFPAGSLAVLRGTEGLRVANPNESGLTLLAFLAPPFPPARPAAGERPLTA